MSAVTDIAPFAHIGCPEALRHLQAWLIWRYEAAEGGGKPRKVPYYAGGGRRHGVQGRPEDRAQMVTFDAARAAAARRGFDGVGLAMFADLGVVAIDFDNCVTAQGLAPRVAVAVADTYAEYSPSGAGVRAFFAGSLPDAKDHGAPFGLEVFCGAGFVTYTGNELPHVAGLELVGPEVAPLSDAMRTLYAARMGQRRAQVADDDPLMAYSPALGLTPAQLAECLDVLDPDMPRERWLQAGMGVHHETEGSEEGFEAWHEWSSRGSKYAGEQDCRQRWDSFGHRGGALVTARTLVKMANAAGAHVETRVLAEPAPAAGGPRFQVIPAATFSRGRPPGWVVKGLIPKGDLVVIYGESGAGKSFVALDLALAIARGQAWRGCRVAQGAVVYVAAEGAAGVRSRLKAYAHQHQVDLEGVPLGVVPAAPNLLEKADVKELIAEIKAFGRPAVVYLDTLAQVTPGANENAGEDMGRALAHARAIARATGALVILVHHAGKDASKGARGWSGLKAAADAELEVVRLGTVRVLQVTKMKDGADTGRFAFGLETVVVDVDDEGDDITSCIVVEAEMPATGSTAPLKPLGKVEAVVNQVIQEFAQAQTTGIEVDAVLAEAARRLPEPEGGKRDQRKTRAQRALQSLCDGDDAPYWIEGDSLTVM